MNPVAERQSSEIAERVADADRCVITAWSAISAFGIGAERTRAGLARGITPPPVASGIDDWTSLPVPDFDVRAELGNKGTRSLDRVTGLTVTAVRELLAEAGGRESIGAPDDIALVVATDTGSIKSMMDFTRDGMVADKPYHVDPSRFPNAVMNCPAGRSAIWYSLRGPNATVSAGRVAGLAALRYGSRLLRGGQAGAVICAAAEEWTLNRAWLEWHARGPQPLPAQLGEGVAVFLVERAAAAQRGGRQPLATVLAIEFRVAPVGANPVEVLTECIGDALKSAAVERDQVTTVAISGDVGGVERAAIERSGVAAETVRDVANCLGDVGAAAAGFAVVAELAASAAETGIALITAYDREGGMGCLVLRVGGAGARSW